MNYCLLLQICRSKGYMYRSVPLIRPPPPPPILYTTSSLKWGEGLYSNMQLVSNISSPPPPPPPPQKKVHAIATYTSKVHVYIRTVTKAFYTKLIQTRIESTVRGHHVYKASWSSYIGEELPVQCEVNNIHDDFAVAVLKNSNTVGHVPREISRVCWYFLQKSGSEMTCIVNGDRRRSEVDGKGLVVPCVYIFKGKQKHLERLINLFAKLTG